MVIQVSMAQLKLCSECRQYIVKVTETEENLDKKAKTLSFHSEIITVHYVPCICYLLLIDSVRDLI